ncbi:lamin tail domain-containing protein [Patescibacteria group bacterium]|nr:lamin tail domain-containing protein [Patescibacteria group bacterium]
MKLKMSTKKLRQTIAKVSILSLFISSSITPFTYATLFQDIEPTYDNVLDTTNLDMEFLSDSSDFEPDAGWIPGSSGERTGFVSNVGDLPFIYSLEYEYVSGNEDLCNAFDLEVYYRWDDGGTPEEDLIYEGKLPGFYHPQDFSSYPHLNPGETPHEYFFKLMLPIDADEDLADEECDFNIKALARMEEFLPYSAFWDEEDLGNSIETDSYDEEDECEEDAVIFMIGDKEDSQTDNTVDEFNWSGEFGVFPDFEDPFVIGTHEDSDFPWNTNYDKGEATDFDVDFYYTGEKALVELTVSWSPGKSADEQKEVYLDGDSVGTTEVRYGASVSGWWSNMEVFQDTVEFELEHGAHTLNFVHLMGDGTLWDYVELRVISCGFGEGDVLINEIMWPGSSDHGLDEWVELYNNTGEDIDLAGWKLGGGSASFHEIELDGIIPAGGYYLVSHYSPDHNQGSEKSAVNDNINADLVDNLLHLRDQGEKLTLRDSLDNKIDETPEAGPGGSGWAAGEAGSNGASSESKWRSMQRNDIPGDGANPSNWHTCTAESSNDTTYWDVEGDDYGTPKGENLPDASSSGSPEAVMSLSIGVGQMSVASSDNVDGGDSQDGGYTDGESGGGTQGASDGSEDGTEGTDGDEAGTQPEVVIEETTEASESIGLISIGVIITDA